MTTTTSRWCIATFVALAAIAACAPRCTTRASTSSPTLARTCFAPVARVSSRRWTMTTRRRRGARRARRVQRRVVRAIRSRALQSPRLRRLALRRGRRGNRPRRGGALRAQRSRSRGLRRPRRVHAFLLRRGPRGVHRMRPRPTYRDPPRRRPGVALGEGRALLRRRRRRASTTRRCASSGHVLPLVRIVRPRTRPSLSVRATTWKNPSGCLPGWFASCFASRRPPLAYLGSARRGSSLARWRTLMPLQCCVALVVALGMAESSAWYFDYVNFNATGYRPYAATVFAVLLGSARKALSVSRARRGDRVRRRSTTSAA